MNNVIDIDSARPHCTKSVECGLCDYKWQAVYPVDTKALECPGCHNAVSENGIAVYINRCKACGREYSVCPIPENTDNWQYCLDTDCISYDESRDADHLFDDE